MESLLPRIMQIAKRLKEAEAQRTKLAAHLRASGRRLAVPVVPAAGDHVVGAVDGGLLKKSFHGIDCVLARAVAVCFQYRNRKVASVAYWPGKSPPAQPFVAESFSDMDWFTFASLQRQRLEAAAAVASLERFPEMGTLLLDGPILPHASDRPAKGSALFADYGGLLDSYRALFAGARERGLRLAGVVEDSRNTAFCEWLQAQGAAAPGVPGDLLNRTRDTNLLDLLLKRGERTPVLPYGSPDHPVLRDLGEAGKGLFSCYLKTAAQDRPVRVDFLAHDPARAEEEADGIAGVLLAVSGKHPSYGLPAPLIEADNAAKLPETEMESVYSYILTYTGRIGSVLRLRREQRPF